MEVMNIFLTNHYEIGEWEKVPTMKKLARQEGPNSFKH